MKNHALDLNALFRKINWYKFHRHYIGALVEDKWKYIVIWPDGSFERVSSRPETETYFLLLPTSDTKEIDVEKYAEGWTRKELDGNGKHTGRYIALNTCQVLDEMKVLSMGTAVQDWFDLYDEWKKELTQQHNKNLAEDFDLNV